MLCALLPSVVRAEDPAKTGTTGGPDAAQAREDAAKPPADADVKTSSAAKDRAFIKGELIHLGTRELVSRYDHAGVRLGPRIINKDFYLGVTPGAVFYPGSFAIGLQVPLNLLMVRAGTTELAKVGVRREDWDEASDYARVIRFLTYGRDESNLYFTISSLRPYTLGHGQLIHNYQPSIDVDRSMTGAVFQAYNDFAGIQLDLNDITFENRVIGALAFVKPLGFADDDVLKSLSLGVEYAADLRAPRCVLISDGDRRCVPGGKTKGLPTGNRAGFDPITGKSLDDTFIRTDPDLGRPFIDETTVQAIGFSGEIKVLKTRDSDLKAYATWHTLIGGGEGAALGLLGRFNLGTETISAFRTTTELRSFSERFQPAYFDTLYEITKYQAIAHGVSPYQIAPTRYQETFGDPEDGFVLTDSGRHFGYDFEASWALFSGTRSAKQLGLGVGLTQSTKGGDTNFYAHAELPMFEFMQLFGTFLRLNATDIPDAFTGPLDNVVVLSGLRFQLLPFLFVNAHYSRMFQIVRGPGHELHLGNENVLDAGGKPSSLFTHDRIYENVDMLFVDLELGLEFRP